MVETKELSARKGLYFEEFEIGQAITSVGRTVTEADVVAFAALSGDWNSIHTDAEFAADHPFGQRVAHGLLCMSIASGLAMRLGFLEETALAFREIGDWKFSLPVFMGWLTAWRRPISSSYAVRTRERWFMRYGGTRTTGGRMP